MILGLFYLGLKVLAYCIDVNGIKNKYIIRYPYPTGVKKMCSPYYIHLNGVKKENTKTITVQHWFQPIRIVHSLP